MRIKSIFNDLISYSRDHKLKAAIAGTCFIGGALLVGAGIALTIVAPFTYGGGAAVGIPLLGVGTGLAAGAVVAAAGVVTTGCATGYFWKSSRHYGRRREMRDKVRQATEIMNIPSILKKPEADCPATKLPKQVRFNMLPEDIFPERTASLWNGNTNKSGTKSKKKAPILTPRLRS